ncbi:MAG: hypothetical protein HY080_07875 [Gammaproteobacteria bacterium]|nr:hypothetical protein [Gammaproteobacteria bacterium]
MYTPIRTQFSFSGLHRQLGFGLVTLGFIAVAVNLGLQLGLWLESGALVLLGVITTLLSYMPAMVWQYSKFSYRAWLAGRRSMIEFKNVYFIALGEKEIIIKAKGMASTLRIKAMLYNNADQTVIRKLFTELEHLIKSAHEERAVKAPPAASVLVVKHETYGA